MATSIGRLLSLWADAVEMTAAAIAGRRSAVGSAEVEVDEGRAVGVQRAADQGG
jgi:hypothetical protein